MIYLIPGNLDVIFGIFLVVELKGLIANKDVAIRS